MKRVIVTVLLASVWAGVLAGVAEASWVGNNCAENWYRDYNVRRKDALAYANVGRYEGYEWGGGCWNDNNRDDTPSAPDTEGEGGDCSGFTFKSWELRSTEGAQGFSWWSRLMDQHGPYSSYDFHSPIDTDPFKTISKSRDTTMYMDAFAKSGHVSMIWTEANPSAGTDYMIHAKGDAYGTLVSEESYRGDSDYSGVRREGWTADCYPNCTMPQPTVVVVP